MKPILILLPTRNRAKSLIEALDCLFQTGKDLFDILILQGQGGPIPQMNAVAKELLLQYEVIGIVADDCRMRTANWDVVVMEKLGGKPGLVYGRDGIQDEKIATHPFVSVKIIAALGFITPPELHNFYADNFLMEIARAHGRLIYAPELFLEHMHYSVGKSPHDEIYAAGDGHYSHDIPAWSAYCQSKLAEDIERIRHVFQ